MFNTGTSSTILGTTTNIPGTSNGISGISGGSTTIHFDPNWLVHSGLSNNTITINENKIMQNKVAVFKLEKNEDNKIIKTEFLKELWVETENGQSVDFQVARDIDLKKYEASDLVIKVIQTVTF